METRPTKGIVLILISIMGIIFSIAGELTNYITRGAFSGITLLSCILLLAGVTLLRDQLSQKPE